MSRFLGDLAATDVQSAAGTLLQMLQSNGADQAVHSEVSAFQTAYNSEGGSPQIAVDGEYGPCTQTALQAVLNSGPNNPPQAAPGSAFPGACNNGTYVPPAGSGGGGGGNIQPSPAPGALSSPSALPTWAKFAIGAVAVLGIAAIWWMMKHKKGGVRRRRHARETKRPPLGSVRVTLPRKARGTVKRRRK